MITMDSFQSALAPDLVRYITLKQALGRGFEAASITLFKLDQFLCKSGRRPCDLSPETFTLWSQTMHSVCSNVRLARMQVVRSFCLYRRRTNPTCFVPDPSQFPSPAPRTAPYIFSNLDVCRLLDHSAAISNSKRSPLRGSATRLAIILLYTMGLRRGELLRLTAQDYDPQLRTLSIRASKFHKSRLLPMQLDVAMELEHFLNVHRAAVPLQSAALFWSAYCGGRAYTSKQLRVNFHLLFNLAGIQKADGSLPHIHDFRTSFAVNALIRWYHNGIDVQAKLPFLAAYMGHVSILSTYYYLHFVEPLRRSASSRFANSYGSLITTASLVKGAPR